jgi:hypothetical protein
MRKVLLAVAALACANLVETARCTVTHREIGGIDVENGPTAIVTPLNANRQSAIGNPPWLAALGRMPLGAHVTELDRTNCIPVMLNAFESNAVVKALIFMPGATDELYFFRRAHATLSGPNASLADAIIALTKQTYIQAAFRPPFLLLRTTEDPLDAVAIVRNNATATKLQARTVPGRLVFNDCEWDHLRAALKKKLSVSLRPFSNSPDSWHFYRNNFAACGLTQWQLLQAIALSGQTTFTLRWLTADFQLDTRAGPTPGF